MNLILISLCVIASVAAQQYTSQEDLPPRLLTIRQRQGARSQQEQTIQRRSETAPLPRGRIAPRARTLIQDEPQQFARSRPSSDEDAYFRPRITVPTTSATPPPLPQTTRLATPKPVIEVEEDEGDYLSEEEEDEPTATTPNSISRSAYVGPFQPALQVARQQQSIQTPPSFQRPTFLQPTAFRPAPLNQQTVFQPQPLPNSQPLGIVKQAPRPLPQLRPVPTTIATRPPATPAPTQSNFSEEEEEEEPQYIRQPPQRQPTRRPQSSENDGYRQQSKTQAPPRQQQLIRDQGNLNSRPYPSKASQVQKERKPVAQIIRKYHNENEDGSITWGYENDDGSFKEETIGNDCVTRGKYGYVDPDGQKREYTYQTGIKCDKQAEAEEAESRGNEGYVDYTNNKYVLPNGDEIDLDDMVKNRARKPVGKIRY